MMMEPISRNNVHEIVMMLVTLKSSKYHPAKRFSLDIRRYAMLPIQV